MIKAPNVVYSTTPNATMVFANFMFKTGLIKSKPALEGAGLSTADIGLVTNFIDSQDYRAHINTGWLELFPDRDNRPARKTTSRLSRIAMR